MREVIGLTPLIIIIIIIIITIIIIIIIIITSRILIIIIIKPPGTPCFFGTSPKSALFVIVFFPSCPKISSEISLLF